MDFEITKEIANFISVVGMALALAASMFLAIWRCRCINRFTVRYEILGFIGWLIFVAVNFAIMHTLLLALFKSGWMINLLPWGPGGSWYGLVGLALLALIPLYLWTHYEVTPRTAVIDLEGIVRYEGDKFHIWCWDPIPTVIRKFQSLEFKNVELTFKDTTANGSFAVSTVVPLETMRTTVHTFSADIFLYEMRKKVLEEIKHIASRYTMKEFLQAVKGGAGNNTHSVKVMGIGQYGNIPIKIDIREP